MEISFLKTFPLVDESRIRDFEALIGHRLPEDYRAFLLKYNGGAKPMPETFVTRGGESSMVSLLYPIGDGTGYDLQAHYAHMRAELPDCVIPIGEDIGGNKICLRVAGDRVGQVLLVEHEIMSEAREPVVCSDSFSGFIESLN